jgi:hypothetical protein
VIRPTATLSGQHSRPITCLSSSYQSRRGAWAEDLGSELVSCDDQGRLCVWQVKDEQSVQCVATMEAGQPCCSLAVRRGFVVAARVDGCVQLYGLVSAHIGAAGRNTAANSSRTLDEKWMAQAMPSTTVSRRWATVSVQGACMVVVSFLLLSVNLFGR